MSDRDTYRFQKHIKSKKKQSPNKFKIEYIVFGISIIILLFSIFDINISFGKSENLKNGPSISIPKNGEMQIFSTKDFIAPLGIINSREKNSYLKFYDNKENLIFTLFVRKNSSVNAKIPLGEYIVKYATGNEWYGYDKLFGYSTQVFEFSKKLLFYRKNSTTSGHTITLKNVLNGNLPKKNISKNDF